MPRRNTNTLPVAGKSKLAKPHVLSTMRGVIAGEHTLTEEELGHMLLHLLACEICESAFEGIVEATMHDTSLNTDNASVQALLEQLKKIHQKTQERDEIVAAYAEMIEIGGIEKANERFPEFGQHVEHCQICKVEVEDMLTMLRQVEQAELIAPLSESGKV